MSQISFRFHGNLNDFLPRKRRNTTIEYEFEQAASLKEIILRLGVPTVEVDLLLVAGTPRNLEENIENQLVDVYPKSHPETLNHPDALIIANFPDGFVLDTHLGKLAHYLRMLGFDTLYDNREEDEVLAQISQQQNRNLLTRDIGLLKRSAVQHGYFVRTEKLQLQLLEVWQRYQLHDNIQPFSRCMVCNSHIKEIAKESIPKGKVPEKVLELHQRFFSCDVCDKVYWRGTHFQDMVQKINKWLQLKLNC